MIHNRDRPNQVFTVCESRALGDQDIGSKSSRGAPAYKLKYPVLTGFWYPDRGDYDVNGAQNKNKIK